MSIYLETVWIIVIVQHVIIYTTYFENSFSLEFE